MATGIKWEDGLIPSGTWNCMHGCSKMSAGCDECYALVITWELEHGNPLMPNSPRPFEGYGLTKGTHDAPEWTGVLKFDPFRLKQPLKHPQPSMVFANSMFDLFHEDMPVGLIERIFNVMREANQHFYIALTKRSRHMLDLNRAGLEFPDNLIMGVSVESDDFAFRIEHLRKTTAAKKLVSHEPAIGPITNADSTGIDWWISGGESGPNYRPMDLEWIRVAQAKCAETGTAFFCKQDASVKDGTKGRFADHSELWVQEWPMPTDHDDPLYKFYMTTEGRSAVMRKRLKEMGW